MDKKIIIDNLRRQQQRTNNDNNEKIIDLEKTVEDLKISVNGLMIMKKSDVSIGRSEGDCDSKDTDKSNELILR